MNAEAITRILEAVYNGADDAGARDEAAIAIFDFAAMLMYFKLGDLARYRIETIIRCLAAEMDSRKDKAVQS